MYGDGGKGRGQDHRSTFLPAAANLLSKYPLLRRSQVSALALCRAGS